MNRRTLSAIIAGVFVLGVALFATPAGAAVLEQASAIRRSFYPFQIETNHTNAALQADQTGSGSIINAKDGGVSEFTIDQSSTTTLNPFIVDGSYITMNGIVASTAAALTGVASTPIAPTGLLQPVAMATAGQVPITIPAAGRIVCIYNTGSQAVSIDDTTTQVLNSGGTPIALGQYDVLCGFSDGTRFIQFATSNN